MEIHQFLHGYSDGHRLLGGSLPLPSETSRVLSRLSDLSGPNMPIGFDEYITGYPLTSLKMYALAYTWYAFEMPRPGCVWTHTLVLSREILENFRDLSFLINYFSRPIKEQNDYTNYCLPIKLHPQVVNTPNIQNIQKDIGDFVNIYSPPEIMEVLYRKPDKFEVVPARNSQTYQGAILKIWSQQWPGLRSRFSFCTGCLSLRILDTRPFDLQIVPQALVREITRDHRLKLSACLPETGNYSPWIEFAFKNSPTPSTLDFQSFLWLVADSSDGRASFSSYARVYYELCNFSSAESIVAVIAFEFPEARFGHKLKVSVLSSQGLLRSISRVEEAELLKALGLTAHFSKFHVDDLDLYNRSRQLWSLGFSEAASLFRILIYHSATPFSEIIAAGLCNGMDVETACQLAEENPRHLAIIFAANPHLSSHSVLWRLAPSYQSDLLEAVKGSGNLPDELIYQVVQAIIEAGAHNLAERVFSHWGHIAVFAILDWSEKCSFRIDVSWLAKLALEEIAVLRWLCAGLHLSLDAISFVFSLFSPSSVIKCTEIEMDWSQILKIIEPQYQNVKLNRVYCFILAVGLSKSSINSMSLTRATFTKVYSLLANDWINDHDWQLLLAVTPEVHWLRRWDKCERLRRGLIRAFATNRWPMTEILFYAQSKSSAKTLAASAFEVQGGNEIGNFILQFAPDAQT